MRWLLHISPTPRALQWAAIAALAFVPGFVWPAALGVGWALFALWAGVFLYDAWRARPQGMRVERQVEGHAFQGHPLGIRLRVTHQGPYPLSVHLREVLHPGLLPQPEDLTVHAAPHTLAHANYTVRPQQRGLLPLAPVSARWTGPLGFAATTQLYGEGTSLQVLPQVHLARDTQLHIDHLLHSRAGTMRHQRMGQSSNFLGLRPYQPGDPVRHIDWKATARRGRPVRREFELSQNQRLVVLLDAGRRMAAHSDGLSPFDQALSSTIALLRVAARQGDHVTLVVYDDQLRGLYHLVPGQTHLLPLLEQLASIAPRDVSSAPEIAAEWVARHVRRRAMVVCVTSSETGSGIRRLHDAFRALRHHQTLWVNLTDPALQHALDTRPATPDDAWTALMAMEEQHHLTGLERALRLEGTRVHHTPAHRLTLGLIQHYTQLREP